MKSYSQKVIRGAYKGRKSKNEKKFGKGDDANGIIPKKRKKKGTNLLGLDLRPKYKKARSIANGSMSILLNIKNKKKRNFMNFDHDLEEEHLKLKIARRRGIPYEELNMGQNKQRLKRLGANNKLRMKLVKQLLRGNQELIKKLKLNSQILNNWLGYVVKSN